MVFRSFVRPSVRPKMCNENEHGDPHFLLRHSKEELKIGRFTEGIFEIRFFFGLATTILPKYMKTD